MSINPNVDIIGLGRILYTAGTPAWQWQTGCFDSAITDTGAGQPTIAMDADSAFAATEGGLLVTPEAAGGTALAASYAQTSATVKAITVGAPTDPVAILVMAVKTALG